MIAFIEENRDIGVEPICKHLPIAPSTFYDQMAKRANPDLLSDRAKRDKTLRPEIERVWEQNYKVYGVRKVWHQMRREGFDIARCTVARLMNDMGLEGVIRGRKARTTIPDKAMPCPLDKVNRQFKAPAPDILWVSDFTYVATWQGFVYVAFVHRCLCPPHRRLAGKPDSPCRVRTRCSRTGCSSATARLGAGASLGSRIAISVDQIHRTPCRGGH